MLHFKHLVEEKNAARVVEWCASRGGVAVWRSINMSNLRASWSTPALTPEGQPTAKPSWEADSKPEVIHQAGDIGVVCYTEVKRFHVAIRRGSQGLSFKLTDASARKLNAALDKVGERSTYRFDYDTQEAIILTPGVEIGLSEWAAKQAISAA